MALQLQYVTISSCTFAVGQFTHLQNLVLMYKVGSVGILVQLLMEKIRNAYQLKKGLCKLNLAWCFGLKLIWLITVSNLFSNLSNTKMPKLPIVFITGKIEWIKPKEEQSLFTYCERRRVCVLPVASDLQHRSRSLSTVPCRIGGCPSGGTRPRNKQCYKRQRNFSHLIMFEVRLIKLNIRKLHFEFL